jgi:hypothetical protein
MRLFLRRHLSASIASTDTPSNDQDLDEARLWEHYGRVLDEYRFQVNLNWSRSQYYFVLNVALLVAGVGLLSTQQVPLPVAMAVFLVGAASAVFAILASRTQKGYYANTRDRKRELEEKLGLGDLAIAPTPGMGGMRGRLARVTTFQAFILIAILLADLAGLGTCIAKALPSTTQPRVAVAVRVFVPRGHRPTTVPLVASQGGHVVQAGTMLLDSTTLLKLPPGRYEFSSWMDRLCVQTVQITPAPLQSATIRCP